MTSAQTQTPVVAKFAGDPDAAARKEAQGLMDRGIKCGQSAQTYPYVASGDWLRLDATWRSVMLPNFKAR